MSYMDRIEYMKNRVVHTTPEMDLENARILTESFKETGGEPLCIRKAKAFRKQCREKTVKIWEKELIVGCSGSKMRGGILCADTCWSILTRNWIRSAQGNMIRFTCARKTGRCSYE